MRRRLWYAICLLDMQVAFDTGSRPSVSQNNLLGTLPKCINDADISPAFTDLPMELPGFTDMTFSSMTYDALICWQKLIHVAVDSKGQPTMMEQDWKGRSKIVEEWELRLKERYLQYCDVSQPLQQFTKLVGEGMIVTMQLLERRPLHGFSSNGPQPTDGYDILKATTEILEVSLQKREDQNLAPWGWHSWAKWYALAIILAELGCDKRGPQFDKAWSVAQASFPQVINYVVDRTLRLALEKLMAKARSMRDDQNMMMYQNLPTVDRRTVSSTISRVAKPDIRDLTPSNNEVNSGEHVSLQDSNLHIQASNMSNQSMAYDPTLESSRMDLDDWMNDPDAMSWVNWELFTQDFSASNGNGVLD